MRYICANCDDMGTYHICQWGYVYCYFPGDGMTAHPCHDCHKNRRCEDVHVETAEDYDLDDPVEVVRRWYATDIDDCTFERYALGAWVLAFDWGT